MPKDLIRDTYNKYAVGYNEKRKNRNSNFYNLFIDIPAITRFLKPVVKNKKVVDLGCGTGILTQLIKEWGGDVVGVDISDEMLSLAKKENPGIEFVLADAENTGLKNEEFDIAASSLMVHYFNDLNPLFTEVNRILKSHGSFIFSFHHPVNEVMKKEKTENQTKYLIDNYFGLKEYRWKMLKDMELVSYHHTFDCLSDSLYHKGFLIERIVEPQPTEEGKYVDEDDFIFTNKIPTFCLIKAVKQ